MLRTLVPRSFARDVRPLLSIWQPSRYYRPNPNMTSEIPEDLLNEIQSTHPRPMRTEFMGDKKLTSVELEGIYIGVGNHREPQSFSDHFAYRLVKTLRLLPDTYFRNDHYMRAVMLETIAAVPGMVGGMLRHMRSLRRLSEDKGWIIHLLHEAENERMHLMAWMKLLHPSLFNRLLILGAQGVFFNSYFLLYSLSPKTAHRMCGYLEEEAIISYTHFLEAIDDGQLPNGPAPEIAIEYYNLHPQATVRDVVLAVRADEALHRDANHHFSDRIAAKREDIVADILAEQHKVKDPSATKA